jgi:hypothetical protein
MMFNRLVHQATAFSLSALFTVAILGSINLLASPPAEHRLMAATTSLQASNSSPQS